MLKRNLQRNQSVLVICSHSTINFMHLVFTEQNFSVVLFSTRYWFALSEYESRLTANHAVKKGSQWIQHSAWQREKDSPQRSESTFLQKHATNSFKNGEDTIRGGRYSLKWPIWGDSAREGYLFPGFRYIKGGRDFTCWSIRTVTAVCGTN